MIIGRRAGALCVAVLVFALSACGSGEPTEDGAREACVAEAGGEANSVNLSGKTATVEGADRNIAWSCIATFVDGEWEADTRPGTEQATQP